MGLQLGKLGGIYGRYNAYPQILQFTGAMNQFPLRLNPIKTHEIQGKSSVAVALLASAERTKEGNSPRNGSVTMPGGPRLQGGEKMGYDGITSISTHGKNAYDVSGNDYSKYII